MNNSQTVSQCKYCGEWFCYICTEASIDFCSIECEEKYGKEIGDDNND